MPDMVSTQPFTREQFSIESIRPATPSRRAAQMPGSTNAWEWPTQPQMSALLQTLEGRWNVTLIDSRRPNLVPTTGGNTATPSSSPVDLSADQGRLAHELPAPVR